jgi:putative ABC transport system substrate-binding protein
VQETRSIPIVFAVVVDPVGSGFVANFNHPGGNVTGFTNHEPAMAGKWLELLKEIAPHVRRAALLYNPATAPYFEQFLSLFKTAAASLGVEAIASPVHDRSDLELAIAALTRVPNGGLVVMTDSYMAAQRTEVTSLALRYRLPLISPYRAYSELGGLLSYGSFAVRQLSARLDLCRSHPQGDQAERIARAGADAVPAGGERQDRQGARPRPTSIVLLARRRGDRLATPFAAYAHSRCP